MPSRPHDLPESPKATAALVLIAAAPVLLVLATAVLLVLGLFDRNPLWPRHALTISEAAAVRDRATVAYLAEGGADITAQYRVRPGLLDNDEALWLTAPEAAILADRNVILGVLFNAGLEPTESSVHAWICLARKGGRRETLQSLTTRFPAAADLPCDEG